MSVAWVGLGANLDDPAAQLQTALRELDAIPRSRCLRHSSLYRSAPIGPQEQPDFCNAVAELKTDLSPQDLLQALFALENSHHRKRAARWGPRTLDLDLLLYDQRQIDTPELTVPHPRMHLRAFVLRPLVQLEPTLDLPGHGPVIKLLALLHEQSISLWDAA